MNECDFEALRRLYKDDLKVLNNPTCQRRDACHKHPLLPWQVGDQYRNDPYRLVFVGKAHVGDIVEMPSGIVDAREKAENYFFDSKSPYWSYTREIVRQVF